MICLFFAYHAEAKPFIEALKLKRIMHEKPFQVFTRDELRLVVSGSGKIRAAAAIVKFLSTNTGGEFQQLFVLNAGVAGSASIRQPGVAYIINKVVDIDSGKSFFSDCLLRSDFPESALSTVANPVNAADMSAYDTLVDMEGAAFFEAASLFLGPEQIALIKVVSDFGAEEFAGPDAAMKLMEPHVGQILTYARRCEAKLREAHVAAA